MKFHRKAQPQDPGKEKTAPPLASSVETKRNQSVVPRRRWSTAFLVAGSALLGATAIAFWNRRTIANLRIQLQAQPEQTIPGVPEDDEIV